MMSETNQEGYTGATERLYYPAELPTYEAEPTYNLRAGQRQAALQTWAMFALLVVTLLLLLARLPQQAAPAALPAVDQHVEVFSRNCVGWCSR